MASGFLHEAFDLIVWGRVYRYIHQAKDRHAQHVPGLRHREKGHEWYQCFGSSWDFENQFPMWRHTEIQKLRERAGPEAAEEMMASDAHDLIDRTWDDLSSTERTYCEGLFVWLIYNPDILYSWAGVDVIHGRISRVIGDELVWEGSPETIIEYRALRRRISKNHKHRLAEVLKQCGDQKAARGKMLYVHLERESIFCGRPQAFGKI
ncbi:MAG: hypothetical protein LAO76_14740 [Acidobacteriia bacterium]|nr:hypothetical protein [Terriglobia bacterium]